MNVREILKLVAEGKVGLDDDFFVVSDKAVHNEYVGDNEEPEIIYDPGSWQEVRRIYADDTEEGAESVLLIVYEGEAPEAEVHE